MPPTSRARRTLPPPDFTNSADLRVYLNEVRGVLHAAAMQIHMSAAELSAALETIQPANASGAGLFARSVRRRRARRVARHLSYVAECLISASAGSVRTWGAFRAEYAPELGPVKGKRGAFRVVPE